MFAPIKRLFKNTVFRLSMIAAGLFVLSSLTVLGYIYYATVRAETVEVDKFLEQELDEIEKIYLEKGVEYTTQILLNRMRPGHLYIFSHKGQYISNIESKPIFKGGEPVEGKPFAFTYKVVASSEPLVTEEIRARGRTRFIGDEGGFIFTAREVEIIMDTSERVRRALFVSMLMAMTLGLLSGVYVSSRFARRIGAFNKLATDIRSGKLDKRASRTETGDELDVLAEHLNDMLDHIDKMMMAMRYAGDSIAHDLRSPLTRLRTRLENAGSDVKDEAAREALFQASDDAGELLKTFDAVLRIARLETGERREMLVGLDPTPILEDLAELYEPSCEDAGLEFSLKIEGKHKIYGDRGLLSQAVSNLVENAIKYTPKGSAITVRLRKLRNGRSEISVTDTGPGIPPEQRNRVKERFVRLEESRTAPGSGLGLSLVDAVADLHRAQFELTAGSSGDDRDNPGLRAAINFPRFKRR
ncbi:MAG: HAMP domain-containing sensor histidine kinase [Robiginitomaculum sp.]